MSTYRMSSLLGRTVIASNGEVGTLYDFYFSDENWSVVHFVVQTGTYFQSRRLLLNPSLVAPGEAPQDIGRLEDLRVRATCEEILASPDYMDDPPVSEQKASDTRLHPRFLWFPTFDFSKVALRPMGAPPEILEETDALARTKGQNPHLRSFREVRGYAVLAADSIEHPIGHVLDLLVVEQGQVIEELLINTGLGHSGDLMCVQPTDIERINWSTLHLYLSRSALELGLVAK